MSTAQLVPTLPGAHELPFDDGEPMESDRHLQEMNLLIGSLRHAWRDRDDFYVAGNMFVYFSETQIRKNDFRGPDVFVVLNTSKRERLSWVAWEENGRLPDVVIELLSESTRDFDRNGKKAIYARQMGVPIYVYFDPFSLEFEGFELDKRTREYRPLAKDARGDIRCAPLGLSLGIRKGVHADIEADWLRWIGPDGEVLPSAEEEASRSASRAEAAERRADDLAARVAELERELRARGPSR